MIGDYRSNRSRIDLADRGAETGLSLRHTGFPSESARDDHVRGWTDCLDRLEAHLEAAAGSGPDRP